MDQLDRDYLQKFIEEIARSNQREGAVSMLLTMSIPPKDIKEKVHQRYPDFDQSKLDDIIAEQKKELGIS